MRSGEEGDQLLCERKAGTGVSTKRGCDRKISRGQDAKKTPERSQQLKPSGASERLSGKGKGAHPEIRSVDRQFVKTTTGEKKPQAQKTVRLGGKSITEERSIKARFLRCPLQQRYKVNGN